MTLSFAVQWKVTTHNFWPHCIVTGTKVQPNMFCPQLFMLPFPSLKPSPNGFLCVTRICYAHFVTCDAIPILMECMQTTCHGMSFFPH